MVEVRDETPGAKTFRLALARPQRHLAGQHYVVRLTAPDGYTASRSYSVASAPDDSGEIELTVERLPDGEVSGYLHDVVEPGDELEVRGPIGGWFVWRGDGPALLVGGGSGLVPLMAMLRLARREGRSDLVRLVVSVRRPADLYYATEIAGPRGGGRLHPRGAAGRGPAAGPARAGGPGRPRRAGAGGDGVRVRLGRVRRPRQRPARGGRGGAPTASGSSASGRPADPPGRAARGCRGLSEGSGNGRRLGRDHPAQPGRIGGPPCRTSTPSITSTAALRWRCKDLLGGKGANLAEMTSVLELPVPPGFTITTDACRDYMHGGWPEGLDDEIAQHVAAAREGDGPPPRRPGRPAARQRPLRRQVLDARDDGHGPQPRPQRPERQGPRHGHHRRALRLRLLPALHRHVRPHRARRRRRAVRAPSWRRPSTTPASRATPSCRPRR